MVHTAVGATAARETASPFQGPTEPAPHNDTQASPALLLESHFPLVVGIVNEMLRHLPSWVDRDCLVQSGVVVLLDAAQRYDTRRAVRFRTYATYRIKGEII